MKNIRPLIVFILFFLFPVIGVVAQFIWINEKMLESWDYANALLSIVFATTFMIKRLNVSKVSGGLLLLSIVTQEFISSFWGVELSFSIVSLALLLILYKLILGFLAYYLLLRPSYDKQNEVSAL